MTNFNEYQYQDLLIRKTDVYAKTKYSIILKYLAGKKNLKILNVGCGSGELTYLLAESGHILTGIDPVPEYIDLAIKNLPPQIKDKCNFKISSLADLPQNEQYDCIVATDVLEHIEDDVGAIKQFSSLLIPGGELIITVPAGPWLFGYHDEMLGHFRRYSMEGIRKLFNSFKISKERYFGFTLIPVCLLYSNILRRTYPVAVFRGKKHYLKEAILRILLAVDKSVSLPFGTSIILSAVKRDQLFLR